MEKIDFVITWVDSNDPKWLAEKEKYKPNQDNDDNKVRYREWDNLKYWFRAVEKYAPWVNKIHFITYGHIPKWLNTNNPKLNIVNHKDYIPKQYLPTFNSNTLEMFLHKIPDLSENFVYFNDDMFLTDYTKETDFFKNNLPCDSLALTAIVPNGQKSGFDHCLLSNMNFINSHFKMKKVIKQNLLKWFNLRYGASQIRTLLLLPWNNFPGKKISHLPISYKKKTFDKVWEVASDLLSETASDRFRNNFHVNHWIFQNWQQVTGKFYPRNINFGKMFLIDDNNEELIEAITNHEYKCLCINDAYELKNFNKAKKEINKALEYILPEKSSFEK